MQRSQPVFVAKSRNLKGLPAYHGLLGPSRDNSKNITEPCRSWPFGKNKNYRSVHLNTIPTAVSFLFSNNDHCTTPPRFPVLAITIPILGPRRYTEWKEAANLSQPV